VFRPKAVYRGGKGGGSKKFLRALPYAGEIRIRTGKKRIHCVRRGRGTRRSPPREVFKERGRARWNVSRRPSARPQGKRSATTTASGGTRKREEKTLAYISGDRGEKKGKGRRREPCSPRRSMVHLEGGGGSDPLGMIEGGKEERTRRCEDVPPKKKEKETVCICLYVVNKKKRRSRSIL